MLINKLNTDSQWWKKAVFYQVYPRSFQDSDGDGIGDINGIISRLDYLHWLGIDAIWINPIYVSPMHDFGYDISDYRAIDPIFGTLNEFKKLISEAHKKNIRVVMDLAINHTSSEHPWFIESRSSKDNTKRDWYIWEKGKGIFKPNNWMSIFGGSAWQYDKTTNEYYCHLYLKQQPDLNWHNPQVKAEVFRICRYWLDMGVDGFRMDSIHTLVKADPSKNNRPKLGLYSYDMQHSDNLNHTKTRRLWCDFRKLLDSYQGRVLIGEMDPGGWDNAAPEKYYGDGKTSTFDLVFDFSLTRIIWNARIYSKAIDSWYKRLPSYAWPSIVNNNHDIKRLGSRNTLLFKQKKGREKVAATIWLTIKNTPFIYYGEEIGMLSEMIGYTKIQDPVSKKYWPFFNRDSSRTPMQWSPDDFAGFSSSKPWLPVARSYQTVNVESQIGNTYSLLNYYKSLIAIRKKYKALQIGEYTKISSQNGLLVYRRRLEDESLIVINNFTSKTKQYVLSSPTSWEQVISSTEKQHDKDSILVLDPDESLIIRLK